MKRVYLAQVECKGENCYQFLTEEFVKNCSSNIKIITLWENTTGIKAVQFCANDSSNNVHCNSTEINLYY